MENDAQKAKRHILTTFIVFAVILALIGVWYAHFAYWHTFSTQKWIDYPERRAKMTADLFARYDLVGMSKEQLAELLGPDNNDYGYFDQANRSVYYLGNERTIIDSEWLLIDFENDTVRGYAMTTD